MSWHRPQFSMTKEKWAQVRLRGFWRYMLYEGILYLGVIGGCLVLAVKYFADSDFSLGAMSLSEFVFGYLVWMPLALLVGFLAAGFIWLGFEEKFK